MSLRLWRQAVLNKIGCRTRLWEHIRTLFYTLQFNSMEDIYRALFAERGYQVQGLVILDSS